MVRIPTKHVTPGEHLPVAKNFNSLISLQQSLVQVIGIRNFDLKM